PFTPLRALPLAGAVVASVDAAFRRASARSNAARCASVGTDCVRVRVRGCGGALGDGGALGASGVLGDDAASVTVLAAFCGSNGFACEPVSSDACDPLAPVASPPRSPYCP